MARARFQLAAGVEAREGYVGALGPKVLKDETASERAGETLNGIQAAGGASLSQASELVFFAEYVKSFVAGISSAGCWRACRG